MTPELERAAQAFYHDFCRGQPWDEATEGWKLASREGAAAVIRSALIEPSEDVVERVAISLAGRRNYDWAKLDETALTAMELVSRATFRLDARAALRAAAMKMLGEG